MTDFNVMPLTTADASEAAELHLNAFPGSLFSALGARFLEVLYVHFATDESALGLVARNDRDVLVGVVVGSTQPDGFFRRAILRRWFQFVRASCSVAIQNPSALSQLASAVMRRSNARRPQGAVLSYIYVDSNTQGTGLGPDLIKTWEDLAFEAGAQAAYLTTDAENNPRVNAFYAKVGWTISARFVNAHGHAVNLYTKRLSELGG